MSIALLVVEAVGLTFVLTRRFGWLWLRGLLCLAVLAPIAFVGVAGVIHAPPYFVLHVRWLVLSALLIVILVLASVSSSLYQRFHAGG